jgi:hypothetical protein
LKKFLALFFAFGMAAYTYAQTLPSLPKSLRTLPNEMSAGNTVRGKAMLSNSTRSSGSQAIAAPVIAFTGNQALRVERTITNTTDSAVCWYFGHMFKNDQQFTDYLKSFVTKPLDTIMAQRQLIAALFDFTKTKFSNNALIFDWGQDSLLFKKEMCTMGWIHSMHNLQCGNFFRHAVTELYKTGSFKLSDFSTVDVPGHSLGQILNQGTYIATDFDAGSGFSWHKNPASINSYASIYDIRADTNLIDEFYTYNGNVLLDTVESATRSSYRQLLSGNPLSVQPFNGYSQPQSIEARYALPGHSSISAAVPDIILAVDVSDSVFVKQLVYVFDSLTTSYQNGCTACADSFMLFVADSFRISASLLANQNSYFVAYNSVTDQGKTFAEAFGEYYYDKQTPPVWQVSGSNTDTIYMGLDLQMPLLVLSTASNGTMVNGDTSVFQNSEFNLWSGTDSVPKVSAKQVNYLQSGYIPPSSDWRITLAVNAHSGMLSLFESWILEPACGDLSWLVWQNNITYLSSPLQTSVSTVSNEPFIGLYPNPAVNTVFLQSTVSEVPVYVIYGNVVCVLKNNQSNSISDIPSGIYLVGNKRLIKL